jgi:hypothetical protein
LETAENGLIYLIRDGKGDIRVGYFEGFDNFGFFTFREGLSGNNSNALLFVENSVVVNKLLGDLRELVESFIFD